MIYFEFACTAYAAQQLHVVSTDFSYTVPSPYKPTPFEFFIETMEPEKFADVVYKLLCAYNPNFGSEQETNFYTEVGEYHATVCLYGNKLRRPGPGLLAICEQQLAMLPINKPVKNKRSQLKPKKMSDNKKYTRKKDRIKVDSKDRSEMAWLRKKFPGFSRQVIVGAVKFAGPLRKDVEAYLLEKGVK